MARLRLHLMGPVCLLDDWGVDRAPRAAKARGILALLGLSSRWRLSRAALADKLWSDRGPEQARASLRQALSALRAAAGPDVLGASAGEVWLNPEAVTVLCDPEAAGGAELAAGLDLRDPEFENWLRDERTRLRSAHARQGAPAGAPLRLGAVHGTDDEARLQAEMALFAAAGTIERRVGLPMEIDPGGATSAGGALFLDGRAARPAGRLLLQLSLRRGAGERVIWTQTFEGGALAEASEALALAALSALDAPQASGAGTPLVMRDLFGFDAVALRRADRALAERQERRPRAPLQAMRAYLRHTRVLERLSPDPDAELDAAWEMVRKALELEPQGALGLAVGSLISGLRGEPRFSLELAAMARRAAPGDPLVRHALSVALSFAGNPRDGHAEALRASESRLSALAPHVHALRRAYAAIDLGDRVEALQYARSALALAPDYRAALRLCAALEYALHDEAAALASLRALRRLEPDFTLDLMAGDRYPVDTLRRAGLLQVTRSGLI